MNANGIELADALVGQGFYKLGYVTNDREAAIEHFKKHFGFEEFVLFEPAFEAHMSDGRTGPAKLSCAFSKGRHVTVELMQPAEGLVDIWASPIRDEQGLAIKFHHFGLVAGDLGEVKKAAKHHGLEPVLEATIPVATFAYFELPLLGHYVEHIQYFGEGGKFLEGVRGQPLPV